MRLYINFLRCFWSTTLYHISSHILRPFHLKFCLLGIGYLTYREWAVSNIWTGFYSCYSLTWVFFFFFLVRKHSDWLERTAIMWDTLTMKESKKGVSDLLFNFESGSVFVNGQRCYRVLGKWKYVWTRSPL